MDYQPACYQCRVDAGKDMAGVKETNLCVPHLKQHCADLTRQLAETSEKLVDYSMRLTDKICELAEAREDNAIMQCEVGELKAEIARLRIDLEVAESMSRRCPAPCGHSSQYCHTEDGGKHIICLLCEYNAAKAALEASDG